VKITNYSALPSIRIVFFVLLGTGIAAGSAIGQENTGLTPIHRFDSVEKSAEAVLNFRFIIKNWMIDGGQTIEEFPERGFLVMQLRGGELTTIIDGEEQERGEDDFWTVPEGATLVMVTGDDSAVIQTVAISRN